MRQWDFKQEVNGEVERLVLDIREGMDPDNFALNMLAYNEMMHLVNAQIMQFNESNVMLFQITGLTGLKQKLVKKMSKKEVLFLLTSILNCFEEAESYMLDIEKLYLNENYVYLDNLNECHMIYLPFEDVEAADALGFIKHVVEMIQPDYLDKDPYLYDIINTFNRGGIRKLADFKELLRRMESREEYEKASTAESGIFVKEEQSGAENRKPEEVAAPVQEKSRKIPIVKIPEKKEKEPKQKPQKNKEKHAESAKVPLINIPGKPGSGSQAASAKPEEPKASPMPVPVPVSKPEVPKADLSPKSDKASGKSFPINFSIGGKKKNSAGNPVEQSVNSAAAVQTVERRKENKNREMYESYESTVLMTDDVPQKNAAVTEISREAKLIRKKDGFVFPLSSGDNMFGSGTNVKYQISGNKAISRNHAVIIERSGRYYLEDCRSTNGTFLNGRRLYAGSEEEITDGAVIAFADEEFEFRMD